MTSRRYLYGVIESPDPVTFSGHGVGDDQAEIYSVHFKDLAMVVSDIDTKHIYPTRKNALCHEQVLSDVMQEFTVIPCAFGTVVPDEGEIISLLELHYDKLKGTFLKIKHKIELGLKVFWKKEFFQRLRDEDPDIKKLILEINQTGTDGNSYEKKMLLGELVEKKVEEKRNYYLSIIFEELSKLAEEAKLNRALGINMVFNAAFLVNKDREGEFDRRVETIYQQYQEDLMFSYSGPWPPHNFTDVFLGGEG